VERLCPDAEAWEHGSFRIAPQCRTELRLERLPASPIPNMRAPLMPFEYPFWRLGRCSPARMITQIIILRGRPCHPGQPPDTF
jgi:hypothetical protein